METNSIVDEHSTAPSGKGSPEPELSQSSANRSARPSVSEGLATAARVAAISSSGGAIQPAAGKESFLAEAAQRDLDATLQLLAERAQYITDASGAAIALRRDQRKDMLCCASAGSNAPHLGAVLSAESGLSGESVRTRMPLRCDDADRDTRVNREGCRHLGISSVAVMPIVSDQQVVGVFELFSGKVNAFNERDLAALERLSQMVETAIKLAHAAAQPLPGETEVGDDAILEIETEVESAIASSLDRAQSENILAPPAQENAPVKHGEGAAAAKTNVRASVPEIAPPAPTAPGPLVASAKPVLWSAPVSPAAEQHPSLPDQTQVPPALRNLQKCQVCGFPVSEGRVLCVECEEKKWKGQLRISRTAAASTATGTAATARAVLPSEKQAAPAMLAARPLAQATVHSGAKPETALATAAPAQATVLKPNTASPPTATLSPSSTPGPTVTPAAIPSSSERLSNHQSAEPVLFSSSSAPDQSWFSLNKYVLGALLLVAALITAVLFFR